jgi:hypothetical protein
MKFVLVHVLLIAATAAAIIHDVATTEQEQQHQQEQELDDIDENVRALLAIVSNANNRALGRNTRALKTGKGNKSSTYSSFLLGHVQRQLTLLVHLGSQEREREKEMAKAKAKERGRAKASWSSDLCCRLSSMLSMLLFRKKGSNFKS